MNKRLIILYTPETERKINLEMIFFLFKNEESLKKSKQNCIFCHCHPSHSPRVEVFRFPDEEIILINELEKKNDNKMYRRGRKKKWENDEKLLN